MRDLRLAVILVVAVVGVFGGGFVGAAAADDVSAGTAAASGAGSETYSLGDEVTTIDLLQHHSENSIEISNRDEPPTSVYRLAGVSDAGGAKNWNDNNGFSTGYQPSTNLIGDIDGNGYQIVHALETQSQIQTADLGVQTSSTITIFVESVDGKTITLDVEPNDTVRTVKEMLEPETGFSPNLQTLIFDELQLDDDRTLSDNNIQKEDTLHLTYYAGGTGTESDPYQIETWHHLDGVREDLDANFKLANSLNESTDGYDEVASESANDGKGFEPVGEDGDELTGTFDGDGHTISDLYIDREDFVGLFGYVGDGSGDGTVKNVALEDVDVNAGLRVGALVGHNDGTVVNASADGTTAGHFRVGGLVGYNAGLVTSSYSSGHVLDNNGFQIGGLVGRNDESGSIDTAYSTATVTGINVVGGVVGDNSGDVTETYATGSLSADDEDVGGIAGQNQDQGDIENAYWDVETTNSGDAVGTNDGTSDATGLTTAEMKGTAAIETMDSFDFESTWLVRVNPDDYPGLRALENGLDPTIDSTNDPVNEGETLSLDVTVTNTDATERTQDVTLSVDGEAVDVEVDLTVSGDDSQQITLNWKTDSGDAGEHDIVVATADTADVATVQVNEAYNVSGTVEDTTFETGIGDIEVTVSGVPGEYTAETDKNGEYTVKNVPESDESYDVIADQEGWDRASTTTAVKDENVTGVDLEITGDARDSITLRDGVTDEPLDGATVRLEEETLGIIEDAFVADENGEMEIIVPGAFTYAYTFSQPGYENVDIPLRSFDPGNEISASYVLAGNAEITGTVTDEVTGSGIEEASVTAQNGTGAYTAETNGAGAFTVERVTGGHDYDLIFKAGGYNANTSLDVTVDDGATAEVDATLLLAKPFFAVEITETNSPVRVGETLAVNASVTNQGEGATQTVTLTDTDFDDQQRDDHELTLGPGESENVTLEWQTTEGDDGEGIVRVATANESVEESVTIEALYAGGSGTKSDPYQIETWHHLDGVRENLDANFTLMNTLNESTDGYNSVASETANGGNGFEPIGDDSNEFTGTFNGSGYQIMDLYINRSNEDYVGLFGYIASDGIIENVGLENDSVNGGGLVGGLVGANLGTVSESYATGSVEGSDFVGGLVGYNFGTVSESYATGSVKNSDSYVGGLVGLNDFGGEVRESYATGSVEGSDFVGGLAGLNNDNVENSYWDRGTTGKNNAIGGNTDGTNLVGFGDTTDTEPAPEMQRFAPLVTMDALSFESPETWTISEGYPRLAWESVDSLTVDSLVVHETPTTVETETQLNVTAIEGGTNAGAGVTIRLVANDSLALPEGTTAVTDANGNATFTFTETTAAKYDLEFVWDDDPTVSATATVTVESAGADSVTIDTQPDESIAGEPIAGPPTVTVTNSFGNPVDGATVTVSEVGGYIFDGGSTSTQTVDGFATFDALFINESATGYVLSFSIDNADSSVETSDDVQTDSFDVTAADANSLQIIDAPQSVTAGEPFTLTINATDEFHNPATDQTLSDVTVNSEFDGIVFEQSDVTLNSTGQYEVIVSTNTVRTANKSHTLTIDASELTNDSVDITVKPTDATTVSVTTEPTNSLAGEAVGGPPTVTVTDDFGNPISGIEVTVSEAGGYSFDHGTLTNTTTDGITIFDDLIINTAAENYQLNVSIEGSDSNVAANAYELTEPFNIAAADANSLQIIDAPDDVDVGAEFTMTISATDEFDNLAVGQTLTDFTISSQFDGTVFEPTDVTLNETGVYEAPIGTDAVLTANDSHTFTAAADETSDDSIDIRVNPTAAAAIVVNTQPATTTANESIDGPPTVTVTDASGNELSGIPVSATLNGSEDLFGTTEVESNTAGSATFEDLRVQDAGTYMLTIEVGDDSTVNVTTDAFEIVAATPATIGVDTQPVDSTAGEVIGGPPTVNVTDTFGNAIADKNVTVILNESVGLDGSTEVETTTSGIATFGDLTITESGTYELAFELTTDGSVRTTTDAFEITAAAPDTIGVDTQPADSTAGEVIDGPPTVNVTDTFENPVGGVDVTATLNGTGLQGTTTTSTDESGLALFGDLSVETADRYTLRFGLTNDDTVNVTTNTFEITAVSDGGPTPSPSSGGRSSSPADSGSTVSSDSSEPGTLSVSISGHQSGDRIRIDGTSAGTGDLLAGVETMQMDSLDIGINTDREVRFDMSTHERNLPPSDSEKLDAELNDRLRVASASFQAGTNTLSAGYLSIEHDLAAEEVDDVIFGFSIQKAHIDEVGLDPEEVTLYRQESDGWNALATTQTGETETHVRFESTSPGLSVFALGTGAPSVRVTEATLREDQIEIGKTATVDVHIENRGQNSVEQTVELTANGEIIATQTVSLEAGETTESSFVYTPEEIGDYALAFGETDAGSLVVSDGSDSEWLLGAGALLAVLAIGVFWLRRR